MGGWGWGRGGKQKGKPFAHLSPGTSSPSGVNPAVKGSRDGERQRVRQTEVQGMTETRQERPHGRGAKTGIQGKRPQGRPPERVDPRWLRPQAGPVLRPPPCGGLVGGQMRHLSQLPTCRPPLEGTDPNPHPSPEQGPASRDQPWGFFEGLEWSQGALGRGCPQGGGPSPSHIHPGNSGQKAGQQALRRGNRRPLSPGSFLLPLRRRGGGTGPGREIMLPLSC